LASFRERSALPQVWERADLPQIWERVDLAYILEEAPSIFLPLPLGGGGLRRGREK